MHAFDVIFFLVTVFTFRISKAITNKITKEKLTNASLWFNKYLENLRDSNIRAVFKQFQRTFTWIAAISFGVLILFSFTDFKSPKFLFLFIVYTFMFSTILAFSIWWAINHKTEIKGMFKADRGFFSILFLLSPFLMLFLDHYYQTGFYEIMRSNPEFPFSSTLSDNQVAIIFTIVIFFVFIIFPYLISIPVYLFLYLPIKAYILYLRLVTKHFSKNLLLWSILLIDICYGIWRFGFK